MLVILVLVGAAVLVVNVVGLSAPVEAIGSDREPAREDGGGRRYIAQVTTHEEAEGLVYQVRPTRAGRAASRDELDIAWKQAVRKGVPDRRGLRQQFLCHPLSVVARTKPTWDLETYRPTVGLVRTMLAGCNPD